jgi:zinc finger SWIM domain-containing protein 3
MLSVKANKKIVQQRLQAETGQIITLKDLSNIASRMKASMKSNDLQDVVSLLTQRDGSYVEILVDNEDNFKGLVYQDKYMQEVFKAYPELVLVDATYKLLDSRMPVYLILSIDGNGKSEIVCVFIVAEETQNVINAAVAAFVNNNATFTKTVVVMSDKDFVEREAFRTHFPNASLSICLFHTMRSFKREVSTEKMGITSAQRMTCLSIMVDLTYSQSEEIYQSLGSP